MDGWPVGKTVATESVERSSGNAEVKVELNGSSLAGKGVGRLLIPATVVGGWVVVEAGAAPGLVLDGVEVEAVDWEMVGEVWGGDGDGGEVVAVEGLGGGSVVEEVMILWVDVGKVVVVVVVVAVEGGMMEVGGGTVVVVGEAVVEEREVVRDVVGVDVCEVVLVEVNEVVVVVDEVVVGEVESGARPGAGRMVRGSCDSTS